MDAKGAEILSTAIGGLTPQIATFPEYIAVFGGALSTELDVAARAPAKSQRDFFVRWARDNRADLKPLLVTPESYEDWNDFNTYSDLLAFEQDLGYLTSAVLIFLEGFGAVAELGSFSQIESLRDRLVVVVYDDRHPKKSFISLGPLRQLANADENSVCVVPHRDGFSLVDDVDVILRHLDSKRDVGRRRLAFIAANVQHQFIALLDILSLLEIANLSDVSIGLHAIGINLPDSRLRQMLFTLTNIGAIGRRQYGGTPYYYPHTRKREWLNYQGSGTTRFNRSRLIAKLVASQPPTDDRAKLSRLLFGGKDAA